MSPIAVALDRNEMGALLVAGGLGSPLEHALISLLALNGLRVSEATGADIEHLGLERGHRTLTITRKGGKVVGGSRSAAWISADRVVHAKPQVRLRLDGEQAVQRG
jgi:integrase